MMMRRFRPQGRARSVGPLALSRRPLLASATTGGGEHQKAQPEANNTGGLPQHQLLVPSPLNGVDDAFFTQLERVCECSRNQSVLQRHGKDESHHACVAPEAVAFPASTAEVSALVKLCGEFKVAIVPFGTGTSLEGHIQATHGGVCVDLGAKMTAILEENVEDMDARVEAGVTRKTLNASLRHTGLEFAVDPGADASLGGMAACGASGTLAVRYGTMRENVTGLTAVLPDGSIATAGGRFAKSSAGYDLTRLLIGSEGTLGVITEVAVRLHPVPACVAAAKLGFETVRDAADCVLRLKLLGLPLRRCELLDATTVAAFNTYNKAGGHVDAVPERATLFLEFGDGSENVVAAHVDAAKEACLDKLADASAFEASTDENEARDLWKARHATYYAALALKPDGRAIVTDSCVPLSAFADLVDGVVADVKDADVVGPVFGHAGDGNVHCILTYSPDDPPEYLERLHAVADRIVQRTLDVGGTVSGEHGVGVGKRAWLRRQYSEPTMNAMANVKRAFDPLGIMNPGKIL